MDSKLIFVISPIGKDGTEIHTKYLNLLIKIKSIATSVNPDFVVERADETIASGSFVKDILEKLQSAYIVIANLTGLNANVFYELGIRHALSKRTIMITEDLETLPSDLREYKVIEYNTDITGINLFEEKLIKALNEIINNPNRPDNPVIDRLGQLTDDTKLENRNSLKEKKKANDLPNRIDYILKYSGVPKPTVITWLENEKEYSFPNLQGDFCFYWVLKKGSNLTDHGLFIYFLNDKSNLNLIISDINKVINQLRNSGNQQFKFVIATDEDFTNQREDIYRNFNNTLETYKTSHNKFQLEIWDNKELKLIEEYLVEL